MKVKDGLMLREVAGQYVIVPTGKSAKIDPLLARDRREKTVERAKEKNCVFFNNIFKEFLRKERIIEKNNHY